MTAPAAEVEGHNGTQTQQTAQPHPQYRKSFPGKRILTGTKKNLARSCRTDGSDDKKQRLLPQEELPPTLQKQQEAERQPAQHPPAFHVWPAVLAPLTASGQERQVVARVTASDHESDLGERETASGHSDLPGGQGTRTLNYVTGSGQTTATGHTESGHGKTGINPRIDTGLPAIESAHVESGSGQKTATAREATAHGQIANATMTAIDALDL